MIVIKTKLRKIPECCYKCKYYEGSQITGQWDDGICWAKVSGFSTVGIKVTKERLKNCPLIEVEDEK